LTTRDEAIRLTEELPDDFSWDDLMQAIDARRALEAGGGDSLTKGTPE
jgi:hypothetical protein